MARSLSFRSPPLALATLLLLLGAGTVLGAQRAPKTKPAPAPSSAGSAGAVLFSTDWAGKTKAALPSGVTLVAGQAHPATVNGRRFLQVSDSASLDLQLSGELPDAYTIEFEMQVPASTAYAVEIRPEAAGGSPAGYAGVSRRMSHPVALCGAIGSGIYAASGAQSQQKRYPDAEAKQLRTCKIEVDTSGVRVFYAGTQAANAVGGDLGSGTLLRLHVPASAQQPALIGPIQVTAAPGTSVAAAKSARPDLAAAQTVLELASGSTQASGRVASLEGGEPFADLVEQAGPGGVDLRPGPVRYADIVAKVGLTEFGKLLGQWASGQQGPLEGRIVGADFASKVQYYRSFPQAQLAEVGFPAFDGASKESGHLQLRLVPVSTKLEAPTPGANVPWTTGHKPKTWLTSNFRLDIPGLATSKVSRIEPFKLAVKTSGGATYVGGTRLTVTFAAKDAATWLEWQDQFFASGGSAERTLELKLLDPSLKDTLLTLKGSGVGLLSLAVPGEGYTEKLPRMRAELYVERWQIVPGASVQ